MGRAHAALMLPITLGMVIIALCGCSRDNAGGPGVSTTSGRVDTAHTFTLDTPVMDTQVRRGESRSFKLAINRGDEMNQQIAIKFDGLPQGITINPATPILLPNQEETEILLRADEAAPIGEFKLTVVGEPQSGEPARAKMGIQVKEEQ